MSALSYSSPSHTPTTKRRWSVHGVMRGPEVLAHWLRVPRVEPHMLRRRTDNCWRVVTETQMSPGQALARLLLGEGAFDPASIWV